MAQAGETMLAAVQEAEPHSDLAVTASTQQPLFEALAGDAADPGVSLIVDDQVAADEAALKDKEGMDQTQLANTDQTQVVRRSSSESALSSISRRSKRRQGSHPFKAPPPFLPPQVDQFGFPNTRVYRNEGWWDERHHLKGSENELKPKLLRQYFSKPQTMDELKSDLETNPQLYNTGSILRNLELPDLDDRKRTPVVPDTGAPLIPHRHKFGGHMIDRDGKSRKWNDRWQNSLSALNDNYHPDHRNYFTQHSLFEESPSQSWRRFLDQEVEHGVWAPTATKKKSRFPPLGARMRGRSGTPIPGATF